LLVDEHLYILYGTNAREYCSNVYEISLKTLECVKLFDSIELLAKANFSESVALHQLYPEEFLLGRYRQEVVHYSSKLYTFGGGKIDADAYAFENLPTFNLESKKWEFISTKPDANTNCI
jgi:hypothetical protein